MLSSPTASTTCLSTFFVGARAELFPRLVQAPEPPREPAAGALEEGAPQPGVPLEHPARREAGEGQHELHRIAPGHADDAPVRMVQIPARDVVAQRGLPGAWQRQRGSEEIGRVDAAGGQERTK